MRDAEAFDEFYRGTSARVMRYGLAMVGDQADARHVVREAYLRAWRYWHEVEAHPAPEAWVRLTVNDLSGRRRRKRPPAATGELTARLTGALGRLPVDVRQAVVLFHLFDLPVTEIAAETGAPVGTVTSWLSQGRSELATALAEAHHGE